jgi:hypothetical protein
MATKTLSGRIHNAKNVTFDGRDCWIAAIHADGRFWCAGEDTVQECESVEDARAWLASRLAMLGQPSAPVTVRAEAR